MSELEKEAKMLTDEELEKVTGGVNHPLSSEKDSERELKWRDELGVKVWSTNDTSQKQQEK